MLHMDVANQQNLDFLISVEETQNLHNELYSVDNDKLLPITSPFLMPGIYRKIGCGVSKNQNANDDGCGGEDDGNGSNVYIAAHLPFARIVPFDEVQSFYGTEKSVLPLFQQQQQQHRIVKKLKYETTLRHSTPMSMKPDVSGGDILAKIANNLLNATNHDSIFIDRKRQAVIVYTPFGRKQKTIYCLLTPEKLRLKSAMKKTKQPSKMPGNKKMKASVSGISLREKKNTIDIDNDKRTEMNVDASVKVTDAAIQPTSIRTRSGRVVKLVKPDVKFGFSGVLQRLASASASTNEEPIANVLNDLKDRDYSCSQMVISKHTTSEQGIDQLEQIPPRKRRVPPEAICPTCNKIFLGRRLQRHFAQNPEHMLPTTPTTTMGVLNNEQLPPPPPPPPPLLTPLPSTISNSNSMTNGMHEQEVAGGLFVADDNATIFRYLISKLQKSNLNDDQRAELFLNEINDLVEQLQLRISRIVRSTSGLHMVTALTARVLGIPEGQYALDISAIEAAPPPELELSTSLLMNFVNTAPNVNTRSMDYTNVSIDDTLTDEAVQKLNLSAGGKLLPPSEESLLRAVDDFVVRDGMEKLSETNLLHPPVVNATTSKKPIVVVPHIDHASDNAVEAVTMKETPNTNAHEQHPQKQSPLIDLAVDFFQFNNN